jgi:protein PET117
MSTAAKATLACTTLGAIGIVLFVHRQQEVDKAVSGTVVL